MKRLIHPFIMTKNLLTVHRSYLMAFVISLIAWVGICSISVLGTVSIARAAEVAPLSACTIVSAPHVAFKEVGKHLAFACTDDLGSYVYQDGLSCLNTVCNVDAVVAAVWRIHSAPANDYKAVVDQETKGVSWTCANPPGDPEKSLCRERMTWIGTWWADAIKGFKPSEWKVKVNGTSTTRPAYSLVNGVLGTKEAGRSLVGAPCDLTKPFIKVSTTEVKAEVKVVPPTGTTSVSTGLVSLCSRVPK